MLKKDTGLESELHYRVLYEYIWTNMFHQNKINSSIYSITDSQKKSNNHKMTFNRYDSKNYSNKHTHDDKIVEKTMLTFL